MNNLTFVVKGRLIVLSDRGGRNTVDAFVITDKGETEVSCDLTGVVESAIGKEFVKQVKQNAACAKVAYVCLLDHTLSSEYDAWRMKQALAGEPFEALCSHCGKSLRKENVFKVAKHVWVCEQCNNVK